MGDRAAVSTDYLELIERLLRAIPGEQVLAGLSQCSLQRFPPGFIESPSLNPNLPGTCLPLHTAVKFAAQTSCA
jgi:hypothetical protein